MNHGFPTTWKKGVRSGVRIAGELENARVGIICLTPENLNSPWINFEAGALSKASDIKVCTLLLDLVPADVSEPLAQFQHTQLDETDLLKLALTLSELARTHAGSKATNDDVKQLFDALWPRLEPAIEAARKTIPPEETPARSTEDKLDEILQLVRGLGQLEFPSAREIAQAIERRNRFSWLLGKGALSNRHPIGKVISEEPNLLEDPDLTDDPTEDDLSGS